VDPASRYRCVAVDHRINDIEHVAALNVTNLPVSPSWQDILLDKTLY
jgi:hypothetical protein